MKTSVGEVVYRFEDLPSTELVGSCCPGMATRFAFGTSHLSCCDFSLRTPGSCWLGTGSFR